MSKFFYSVLILSTLSISAFGQTTKTQLDQVKKNPQTTENSAKADAKLIDLMLVHQILINRPIVVTPLGVRLCRPSEVVLEILPNPDIGPFTKEDGEIVNASGKAEL